MISLYLLPDRTRAVRAEMVREALRVKAIDELSSYWDALTAPEEKADEKSGISRAAQALTGLFREAGKALRVSGEAYSIVLPDSLFLFVNCEKEQETTEEEKEQGIEQYAANAVGLPADSVSVAVPFETRPGPELFKTIFAIHRDVIQRLVDAAGEEGVTLASVEPASVAFLRASGAYDREYFFLESGEETATVVAYSPVGGMFRMTARKLAENRLLDMPEVLGDMDVKETLAELDVVAAQTYPSANDDVPVVLLTGNRRKYEKFPILKARMASLSFAEGVIDGGCPEAAQDWMAAIGTLLQDAPDTSPIYAQKPTFLACGAANLLPDNIQTNAKFFRVTQKIKRISRVLLLVGVLGLTAIAGPAVYFSSFEVPQTLRERYETTQKELPAINAALASVAAAKKEHCRPMTGFEALLKSRPDALGFSRVRIGEGTKNAWMEAELVSTDALTMQDYVSAMSEDNAFQGVSIVRIGTDASGYKTATVTIRKGEANAK